jgi:hypothetical protein
MGPLLSMKLASCCVTMPLPDLLRRHTRERVPVSQCITKRAALTRNSKACA